MKSEFERPETVALWRERAAQRNASLRPATERMLERAGIAAGMRVLDVGTGTGDVAALIAARVGPGGAVVGIDPSPAMLAAAPRDLPNLRFIEMDAASLAFGSGEFDAVVARNALMFLRDLPAAMVQFRRVLRRGGRFAAIFWAPPSENALQGALIGAARDAGRLPSPPPELVVAFSLPEREVVAALERAGFGEISCERVAGESRFASLAQAIELAQSHPVQRAVLSGFSEAERPAAWQEVRRRLERYDAPQGCALPISLIVVSGRR